MPDPTDSQKWSSSVDLNVGDAEGERHRIIERERRRLLALNRRRAGNSTVTRKGIEEAEARLEQAMQMTPTSPRIRVWSDQADAVLPRATEGAQTVTYAGMVELANLPRHDHDYRIKMRWSEDGNRLEAEAVCILARPNGPPVTNGSVRDRGLGGVIRMAAQHLTKRRSDGRNSSGTRGDADSVLRAPQSTIRRRSSVEVRALEERAAEGRAPWSGGSRWVILGFAS